jgi:lysozyme family protein
MADFNKALNIIFKNNNFKIYSDISNIFSIQSDCFYHTQLCWNNMRKLGFTHDEILKYIKCVLCKEVWNEINGNKVDSQELAEAMFTFSLNNGSDHCLYLLNSTLNLDDEQCLLELTIDEANKVNADDLLVKFSLAKIIYYNLSNKYISYKEKEYTGKNS